MSTQRGRRRAPTRVVAAVFAGYGAAQVAAPMRVARALTAEVPAQSAWVVRLLGGRQLLQHAAVLAWPRRDVVLAGAAVDAVHAASMLAVAALWRAYRRPALVSAVSASTSAVVGLVTAPRASRP